ncbi:MAG: hypothetical protein R3Y44_03100 [Rikenellaceae bacterium]
MKKNFRLFALAMLASAVAFTSCESTSDDNGDQGSTEDVVVGDGETLPAEVSGKLTISEGASVKLDGGLHVVSGGTLVIEPGVTITAQYDNSNCDYIFIEQGGKIEADGGDADGVIVMTSNSKKIGAWGGIHICGYAPINTSIPSSSEIEGLPYGGTNSSDNSGTLRYVRLEYTGYSYDEDQECNGVSFYGVGNGTTVEYVQAYRGSDDGFEFFGGTVNIKYCVATSCSDDSFDWTDGWVGSADYIVAYQEEDIDYKCDCLLECDNQGTNNAATPLSHPTISNATLVGYNYPYEEEDDNGVMQTKYKADGVMLKAGTAVNLENVLIIGKSNSIYVKTDLTDGYLADGTSELTNVLATDDFVNGSSAQTCVAADLTGVKFGQTISLTNNYVGLVDGAGAVSADNDWTAGWTL